MAFEVKLQIENPNKFTQKGIKSKAIHQVALYKINPQKSLKLQNITERIKDLNK